MGKKIKMNELPKYIKLAVGEACSDKEWNLFSIKQQREILLEAHKTSVHAINVLAKLLWETGDEKN